MKKFIIAILVVLVLSVTAYAEFDADKYQEQIERCSVEELVTWDTTDIWLSFNDVEDNRFHIYGGSTDPESVTWCWYVGSWEESDCISTIELTEDNLDVYFDAVEMIFENELS